MTSQEPAHEAQEESYESCRHRRSLSMHMTVEDEAWSRHENGEIQC